MANNLAAFNSEAWSERLVTNLDQVNIMLPLINRNWEGDLTQNKTVWIRTPSSIAMASYTRGTTISYQDLTPGKEAFTVNDGEYFAFEVDDIDKAQSDISAMDVYMKRAVVAMNNTVEAKLLSPVLSGGGNADQPYCAAAAYNQIAATDGSGASLTAVLGTSGAGNEGQIASVTINNGGTGYTVPPLIQVVPATNGYGGGAILQATLSGGAISVITVVDGGNGYQVAPKLTVAGNLPITLDSTTSATTGIYQLVAQARFKLTKQNVPQLGRWLIVDPNGTKTIEEDTAHFVRYGDLGDEIVQSGVIGGEEVVRRASDGIPGFIGKFLGFNVYETPHVPIDTDGSALYVFGDNEAISYAAQITEIEALRLQTTFANAIRGLLLHDVYVPRENRKRLGTIRVTAVS